MYKTIFLVLKPGDLKSYFLPSILQIYLLTDRGKTISTTLIWKMGEQKEGTQKPLISGTNRVWLGRYCEVPLPGEKRKTLSEAWLSSLRRNSVLRKPNSGKVISSYPSWSNIKWYWRICLSRLPHVLMEIWVSNGCLKDCKVKNFKIWTVAIWQYNYFKNLENYLLPASFM